MSKEQVTKIKRMISRLELSEIGEVIKYSEKKHAQKFNENMKKQDQDHIDRMKKLPIGTKIIIKFTELANQTGEIIKHGTKWAKIKLDDGKYWKIKYRAIDDRLDDESVKMTARSNANFVPVLNKIMYE